MLPLLSVALQVTLVWPTRKRVPEAGAHVTSTSGQLSLPFKEKLARASQRPASANTLISPGHTMRGFSPSSTCTWKEHVLVFWLTSIAVQTTLVEPLGNNEPLGGKHIRLVSAQLSVACAWNSTVTSHCPGSVRNIRSGGQEICG